MQRSENQHLTQWLNSGVDEEIFHLNVKSLCGTLPYEYLLYSLKISRCNDGRLRDRDLKKYQHIELGGWWCNGVDPLNNYVLMMWGCFKPDHPRRDRQKIHKFIKYEHPYRNNFAIEGRLVNICLQARDSPMSQNRYQPHGTAACKQRLFTASN